jgi:hypothetical protein
MKERRIGELVGAVIGNLIAIVLVNTVLLWRHYTNGVILSSWVQILWAANLAIVVQIIGNILLALYRPARMYSFIQALFAAVNLVSIIVFYIVFPLDFTPITGNWLNGVAKAVLIVAMAGTAIGLVVHVARAAAGTPYAQTAKKEP